MQKPTKQAAAATVGKCKLFSKSLTAFCALLVLFNAVTAQTPQQRKWFHNSKDVDFTTTPPTVSTTTGVSYVTVQNATNGVHDKNNNRVFNINGLALYSPVNATGTPLFYGNGGSFNIISPEIVMFPKPGSCDSFYVFYSVVVYHNGNGCGQTDLRYYLIDKNTLNTYPNYGLQEDAFIYQKTPTQQPCPLTSGLAVSKEKLIGGIKTRQLYYTEYDNTNYVLKRIDITYNSISAPVTLYTHTDGISTSTYEMELSPDGTKLAIGRSKYGESYTANPTKDVILYYLNAATGNLNTALGASGIRYIDIPAVAGYQEAIIGVEFNSASNRLFVSRLNEAIWYIENLNGTPTLTTMGAPSNLYTFSQIEMEYNGGIEYMAVAKSETEVYRISNPTIGIPGISLSPFYNNTKVPTGFYTHGENGANNRKVLLLPDQVDGESISDWYKPDNSARCCMSYYDNEVGKNYKVTTNQTWTTLNNPFNVAQPVFDGKLVISPGVTLTLQGITLRFQPTASLEIQKTGQVNLAASKLTGLSCGLMWRGVRVLGTNNQLQNLSNQGALNLSGANGVYSVIENAECAVALYDREGDPTGTTTTGGIVQGAFTNFLNNIIDIDFKNYPFSSASNVRYCSFVVNNNYLAGNTYNHRVLLKNITGIKFYACTFANDKTSFYNSSNTMEGISAENANFTVDRWCGTTPCQGTNVFRNFFYGVRAKYLTTQRNFTVKYSTFNTNNCGILTEGVNNFVTTNNTFNSGFNANFFSNLGMYVHTGTGFTIQSNLFHGNGSGTFPISYGCYINNTGQNSNLVYRNTYNNLWEANGAENVNRVQNDDTRGLFYQCNSQTLNRIDMYVYGGTLTNQPYGIRENHFTTTVVGGLVKKISPNNTFSNNSSTSGSGYQWNDIYLDNTSNILENIIYKYNPSNSSTNPIYHTVLPTPGNPNVDVAAADVSDNTCAVGGVGALLASGGSYESNKEAYLAAKSAFESANYLYTTLIDNGNTELLKESIDTWSQDEWDLRNKLIAKSPNLSTEAIEHVAKEGLLPAALLFDICTANPSSVKDIKFLDMLQTDVPNPLSEYMVQLLLNLNEPDTYRKILEGALNNSNIDYNYASNLLIADYLDESEDKSDSIEQVLSAMPNLGSKYRLAEYKLSKGETMEAMATLSNLENSNPNIEKEDPTFHQYKEFISFLATNRSTLTSNDSIPSDLRNELITVATNLNHPGFIVANNILRADGNWKFEPQARFPENTGKKEFEVIKKIQIAPVADVSLSLYPNPASTYITLELNYNKIQSNLMAEIIDNNGKQLSTNKMESSKSGKTFLNISIQDLPKGTYVVNVKDDDRKLVSKLFTKVN